ncbi:MAG: type II toxin-antitoxin system prevent-host-death family antitoxin [Acidobacteria bacterium]|nr:MAG: type II toxin-antitoxin system prevent-host-death family antitoxin [Acidobacteriota bacterium]PYV78135.1 MAG: type II toxin-antitoxin system prevent-host-death family antitoxin [Acidobacteriota bacterium]
MKYTVHQTKTNLSRLLEEASAGKEVVIARGKEPVAKIIAIGSALKRRVPGRLAGKISASKDAFAPLTDRELKELGFE